MSIFRLEQPRLKISPVANMGCYSTYFAVITVKLSLLVTWRPVWVSPVRSLGTTSYFRSVYTQICTEFAGTTVPGLSLLIVSLEQ